VKYDWWGKFVLYTVIGLMPFMPEYRIEVKKESKSKDIPVTGHGGP
jgi:hypothetical protein